MNNLTRDLILLLERLKQLFDKEGWYCVISDKYSFNQNPDLNIDFDLGFDYEDVRTLSIIDIENRIVLNAYFYILDNETLYLLGNNSAGAKPIIYRKHPENFDKFVSDVKRVMNYY